MSWAVGYDSHWRRDIGYGVPALCDHEGCTEPIDRGLSYICGGEPYGGEEGCGLYFCSRHLFLMRGFPQRCERCCEGEQPFNAKPDVSRWIRHKLTDATWQRWRDENPDDVAEYEKHLQGDPVTREQDETR